MGKVQEEIATRISLDSVQAVGSLKGLQNAITGVTSGWKAQEIALKSSGDYLGAAKEKYNGLSNVIDIQKQKIAELETRQRGLINVNQETARTFEKYNAEISKVRQEMSSLDTSLSGNKQKYDELNNKLTELKTKRTEETNITQKDADAYLKLEKQIQSSNRQLSSYEAQQKRASDAVNLQKSGVLQLKEATSMATKVNQGYVAVLEAEGKTWSAQKAKLNGLVDVHQKMDAQLQAEKGRLSQLKNEYGETSSEYQKQIIRVNSLTAEYKTNETQIKSLSHTVGGMTAQEVKMRDAMSATAGKVKSGFASIRSAAIGASIGVGVVGAAMLSGAKKASEIQSEYKLISNNLVTNGEKQVEVTKNVAQMQKDGAKYSVEYGKSQKSISEQYLELAKRGYTSTEALGAMKSMLQASIASGDDFNDVVSVSAQTIDSFGMRTENTAKMTKNSKKVVNELSYSADETATSFQQLGKGMEYVGDVSHNAGFKLSETSAAMGELSNHGLEADKAGTGLRKAIVSLAQPSAQATSALKSIGISSTNVFKDANGNFKSLSSIMGTIESHTKNLGSAQQAAVFKAIFGATGMTAAQILAVNNKELSELTDKVQKAGDKGTYVQTLAQKNSETAQQSEARFKQAWSNLTIMFGSKMLPYMTDAANKMSKMFADEDFQRSINKTATATAKVAGGFLKIGEFAAEHIGTVKTFAEILGAMWVTNKVAKFANSLQTLHGLFSKSITQVEAETTQVGIETKAYQELAVAKETAADVGGTSVSGTAEKATTAKTGVSEATNVVGDVEKTAGKSSSKWSLLGKSLGTRIVTGAGLALTAWDVGSSVTKAVTSGKATAKYKAVGTTAGTLIGGGIGLAFGGPVGAAWGATIGDQIGSSKTASNIVAKLSHALSGKSVTAPKVKTESTKKALDDLQKTYKSYYSKRQKQDLADLKELHKTGNMTDAEYAKQVAAVKKKGSERNRYEKLSDADQNAIAKYYAQQKASLTNKWNSTESKTRKKWNNQIAIDEQRYGKASYQVQKDIANKKAALKKEENKKDAALDKLRIKSATQTSAKEAKLHTTLTGKIQNESNKQLKIIKKLTDEKGKLSNKQLQSAVNAAQKEYDKTKTLANKEYSDKSAAAKKQYESVTSAADRQYKETVAAANRQYKGNRAYAKQQREKVTQEALDQLNKTYQHASDQEKSVTDKAETQRKNAISKAEKQRDQVKDAAREQSKGVVTHAVNQANSSMEANKKQGEGTGSIWSKIADFFNKIAKPFGVKTIDAGKSAYSYSQATIGAYSTGGAITQSSKALVGEAGVEARYKPYSGQVDFLGVNGPEFVDVRPGEQILNANDTRKLMNGQYKNHLPGYADGTSDIDSFIKSVSSGASSVWDKISDTASEALEKITDPLKSLKRIVSSTFDINSVSGVGSEQRGLSGGMTDKITDGVAQALNKLKKAFDDLGGGDGNSKAGKMSMGDFTSVAHHAALLMHQSLSASDIERLYWQAMVESTVNPAQGGGIDDHDGTGRPVGLMQYKLSTWKSWAVKGHANIHSALDQIMAVLNDSNWHKDLAPLGKRRGWGPTGHKQMATGGLVSTNQMVELAEHNKPEYVIPTDPAQHSRASMLLKEARQSVEGSSDSGLAQKVEELTNVVNQMATMMKTIIGLNADQITATKGIGTFDQNKFYKKMATDQGLSDYQSF